MIYFLDNSLQLQKIVTSKNIISAIHEHELNGLIRADVELDLSYANKFLVLGIDHVGYYYKDDFYLHKIQRVEYDHVNETATVVLRHIFFEDMIFGKLIRDVRPQNQDALTVSRQTIDANTRWQTIMTDVTGRLSTNFYWQVPYEVIEFMTENYRIEYLPKILFDGQKINGFQLHLANKIGEDKNIRIPYGSRVLDLKYEEDYSEIITKLVVHGKGEEVGDGYGRRVNISDVNFSKNGVESPLGSLYLEDETITATYGNDGQTPREGRVVFEDIENSAELANAAYEHYLTVSRPQMLFTADVADIGDVGIGDSVMIIRREYDVYFKARIHKLSVDLLYPEDAQVELGDYEHFKESKVERKTREKNNRVQNQLSDRITRLKQEANDRFDNEVKQWFEEYDQALIDSYAEVAAAEVRMTEKIETERTQMEADLNRSVIETKGYAEQQAQEKAESVRTELETVTNGHQQMLDSLQENVINIDDFLGDSRSITLDERFQDIKTNFEERIRNIDSTHYNIVRGTSFDDPNLMSNHGQTEILTNETDNFARLGLGTTSLPYLMLREYFNIEAGETYNLIFTYRTADVPEIDFIRLRPPNDYGGDVIVEDNMSESEKATTLTNQWTKKNVSFVSDRDMPVRLMIGTNFGSGNTQRGILDIKKPYLTTTNNREWLPHPDDAVQNVSEVVRRVTLLEDGQNELITRTEFDFETENIIQDVKRVESTVEGSRTVLQRLEDWEATNGAAISETVYGFEQKVWLNDVANIGANLIPQSANAWEDGGLFIEGGGESGSTQHLRTKERIKIQPNTTYTLSSNSTYLSNIERVDIHQYLYTGGWINRRTIPRNGEVSFTTWGTADTVRITLIARAGFSVPASFIEHPDGRVKIKLEVGSSATPMLNAISRIEQLANSVSIQVQEMDGEFLSQSDIQVHPGYVQLGSQRLGDSQLASIFRVSPNSIDAITSNLNLTGNLNTNGQITSLAVDAIEGSFARLFANQLTANVITSEHIQVGTALVDKMFATRARIDELITKTHFVNEMHALTLNVVDLNASQIRTRLLSANTIEASWIKSGTALLDRVFSSTAMFERMMAKSGFVTTLNTVTIDTDQITIRRSDGGVLVSQGMQRFGSAIITKPFPGSEVTFDGTNYVTTSRGAQTFERAYGEHSGRWANFSVRVGLRWDSDDASSEIGIVIRPGTMPSGVSVGTHVETVMAYRGSMESHTISVRLPVPTFGATSWTLEFYRIGDNSPNYLLVRSERCWTSA